MSERPDTAALLAEVTTILRRYAILPGDHFYDVVGLWVLHAHAIEAAETTPRLIFKSPEKESGKTRMLELLEFLTPNPMSVFNATIAYLFRQLKEEQATLLFDEVDAIFGVRNSKEHEDLRAVLNAGYHQGAYVGRVVGAAFKAEKFPVYAATALASIGDLPDTIESRAVIVPMRRRAQAEVVAQFRRRRVKNETQELREALAEWAEVYKSLLTDEEPEMPPSVSDRAADIWEPLIAIADLAGGDWPVRARAAATAIVGTRVADDASVGVRLLSDCKAALDGDERVSTAALLDHLNGDDEAGWGGWNAGKGVNARDLARRLKPYGIHSKNVRLSNDSIVKGYSRADFADAWSRYLGVVSATDELDVADVADVADFRGHGGEPHSSPDDPASIALEVVPDIEDDEYRDALLAEPEALEETK